MDIKEIALKVSVKYELDGNVAVSFAEALVAELQRQSEPVGYFQEEFYGGSPLFQQVGRQYIDEPGVIPLFTFPPSIEALEDKVAEACADMCLALVRKEKSHAAGYGPGYLNYTAQDVADMISSGEWKKFRKGE